LRNGFIVRSELFNSYKNIGNPISEAQRFNEWNVDELIYIDISPSVIYERSRGDHKIKGGSTFLSIVEEVALVCRMPLTFGGGIRTLNDIRDRLFLGADKVTINTMADTSSHFVREAVEQFGSQCIVASVDYIINNGRAIVQKPNMTSEHIDLIDHCLKLEELGVGEIFLNSVDRDGTGHGYDLNTTGSVCASVSIPVISCGGAANEFDVLELAQSTDVSGLAAGNMFHFTEHSYQRTKKLLVRNKINIRPPE
jgi:cyclase